MNDEQKQQLKELLTHFTEQEKLDLKQQTGIDLDTDLDPDNIDPELAEILIDSGVLDDRPQLSKVTGGDACCSFCGKSTADVGTLITSPTGAKICRQCILQYQSS
ncbi:ClpX C4-type zinc finger protein [Litoribrevibacter euphylliae]|uniref:ClpX C4-type zinc finger protein n=1 Tax=Litoribrevibacter euphylliae TaxID=1834034 RepID=A0ABV7HJZ0_9GAMM